MLLHLRYLCCLPLAQFEILRGVIMLIYMHRLLYLHAWLSITETSGKTLGDHQHKPLTADTERAQLKNWKSFLIYSNNGV